MATKRMLIDAAHPEETRVAVVDGNQLEEFDVESGSRKQLKGNIYLAKVTRVEPSLQAAFVDYGGNRHGFLAFNEIHPDYYQIPVADRERLIAEQEEEDADLVAREEEPPVAEGEVPRDKPVETVGGDEIDEAEERRSRRALRHYKIQEVIKRRQILLVQVVKEERGNKGAALTTYLSLAGRYCVLMPNTGKGGGISRKIGQGQDRKRLKSIISDLDIPSGMAVIVRTAGADRGKAEIKRDYDYLLRLWNDIRNMTLASTAPALIHEEANIINRAVRDLYTRDIEEIVIEGDEGYRTAKDLMKMLIPSHAKKVQAYKDPQNVPLFSRYNIESQLESMNQPQVQLKSGGYIVINATEALVAIDVNSGRATRGRNIEETALKTNIEAAGEVARQLRLRDLAGLVVVDFIDMDVNRNQAAVERRMKEAMRRDRARIQIGRISPFGLLELSRQRLRPSLAETITDVCQYCGGTGIRRSTESTALHVLRGIEDEAIRHRARDLTVTIPPQVAMYLLNHKRSHLTDIEQRFALHILVKDDDTLIPPKYVIERGQPRRVEDAEDAAPLGEAVEEVRQPSAPEGEAAAAAEDAGGKRKRRRRPRGRKRVDDQRETVETAEERDETPEVLATAEAEAGGEDESEAAVETVEDAEAGAETEEQADASGRRRRGRRGGRGRARKQPGTEAAPAESEEAGEPVAQTEQEPAESGDLQPAEAAPATRRRRVRRKPRTEADEGVPAEASSPAEPTEARDHVVASEMPVEPAPTLWAATETDGSEAADAPLTVELPAADEGAFTDVTASRETPQAEPVAHAASQTESHDHEPSYATAREVEHDNEPQETGRDAGQEAPVGPPRRGWWQRFVE